MEKSFSAIRSSAVPVFFIISFLLTTKLTYFPDGTKTAKRFFRLFYPSVMWGVIYYTSYWIIDVYLGQLFFSAEQVEKFKIPLTDLLWQTLLGSDRYLNPPLWYMYDLMIVMFLFLAIFKYFRKYSFEIISVLGILSLSLQYSGLNVKAISPLQYEMCYTLGRIVEMIPYAIIGLVIGLKINNLFTFAEKSRILRVVVLSIIVFATCVLVPLKKDIISANEGFGYQGLKLIVISTSVFLFVYSFVNIERYLPLLKDAIRLLAKYSLGVYCLHFAVGKYWNIFSDLIGRPELKNTIFGCIVIYIVCLVLSYGISKVPTKYARMLVE
ncbi:MAG: acyltransferase [Succinivibrio dextrinosolvens]|nr:acyltransferase [Succinivibrio dextrinosolvens]